MDWVKKLHDTVMSSDGEDDSSSAKKKTPAATPGFDFSKLGSGTHGTPGNGCLTGQAESPAAVSTPMGASPFLVPTTTVLDDVLYQRVLNQTNFDKTPVGQIVHKYFDALEDSGMDVNARFKTAIKQAAKLEGVASDKVLLAFEDMKAALQTENDKFTRVMNAQIKQEIEGRQTSLQQYSDQIAKLNQQIVDLQNQHTKTSAELAEAQARIANAQTQMQLATTRRAQEIETQKAQFTGLLR